MGCIQGDKENYYNFFNARKVNGLLIGEKAPWNCFNTPQRPTLFGSVISVSKVQLSWVGGKGAVNFRVYKSTNNFTFDLVDTTSNNSYIVTGLDSDTLYYFKVCAVSVTNVETCSNVVQLTTPQLTAPYGLTLEFDGLRTVDLEWTSSTGLEEDGFVIQRSDDGIVYADLVTVAQGVTEYSDTTVLGDNTYYYKVAATDGAGRSPYSNIVSQAIPVIPAPSDLVLVIDTPSQNDLIWLSNSDGFEDQFEIERSTDGVIFNSIGFVGSGVTTFTDLNEIPNTEYWYRVRAIETGTTSSGYSNVVNGTNTLAVRSFNNFDFGFHQFGEIFDPVPVFGFKTAIASDGVNDGLDIDSSIFSRATPSNSFTFLTWFKLPNAIVLDDRYRMIDIGNNVGGQSLFLVQAKGLASSQVELSLLWEDNSAPFFTTTHTFTPSNTWHHIAADLRRSGGDDVITIYLDGVQVSQASVTRTQNWNIYTTFASLFYSQRTTSYSDDVLIMDIPIILEDFDIASNISDIYNSGNGLDVFTEYPLAQKAIYYDFDEADDDPNGNGGGGDNTAISSPEIVDRTGNGYTGTLVNFAKTGTTSNWIDH